MGGQNLRSKMYAVWSELNWLNIGLNGGVL
jgi:hypothetical protein